jgi:hypothetical protein
MPPSGLMAFPRAETMDALKYRRTVPVPPVRSFESTDVILQDQRIIQYLVRVFEEGIDQINEIADDREEKLRLKEEDRNIYLQQYRGTTCTSNSVTSFSSSTPHHTSFSFTLTHPSIATTSPKRPGENI